MVKNNREEIEEEEQCVEVEENDVIISRTNEARFIGCLFLNNDLFLEYEKVITAKYYFSDEFCFNAYEWLSVLFNKGQKFSEKNLVLYLSEDDEKKSFYKKYGGWKTIEEMMNLVNDESEFKSYFEALQKYSLLRELAKKEIGTSKIRASKNFDKFTANDVYNKVRKNIDTIHTRVTGDIEIVDAAKEVRSMTEGFLERPALGTLSFMPTWNELFRGFQSGSMMCFGLMSNFGKTRLLAKVCAFNALIKKEKTLLMLNEMTESELRLAILTTVINNDEFKSIHGIDIDKPEREIALGSYKDSDGNFIYRKYDSKSGEYTESPKEYKMRVAKTSKEYRDVMAVGQWIEDNSLDKYLSVVNVAKDYTDLALETCIRKNSRKNFKFFAYDNLKSDKASIGDWSGLLRTSTTLSEIAKDENVFIYGSIQLTPDTVQYDVLELNSMNIAASKGLKNVLDILILGREIEKEKYKKYLYIPTVEGFGETSRKPIPLPDAGHDWRLQGHIVDKNRYGGKEPVLVQVDLNRNIWKEIGILVKA
jgi:hypothetical protein